MRIKLLRIKEYKNLKELSIKFIDENIDVFIGNNGSGKTNIYEFILKVFRKASQKSSEFTYEFILDYEIDYSGTLTFVSLYGDGTHMHIKVNNKDLPSSYLPKEYMPKNIVIYYSGTSKRLQNIGINNRLYLKDEYFPLVFISLLTSSLERNHQFLQEYFQIDIHKKSTTILKVKNFFQMKYYISSKVLEDIDQEELEYVRNIENQITNNPKEASMISILEQYINELQNITKISITKKHRQDLDFLQNLIRYSNDNIHLTEDKNYFLVELEENLKKFDAEGLHYDQNNIYYDNEFFKRLLSVKKSKLLRVHSIYFYKENIAQRLSYKDLSEGETQFILIQGIIELFSDNENLFLLDEADTYLHPSWQRKILNNLRESKSDNIHILFTSHSPQTIGNTKRENIFMLENGNVRDLSPYTFGRDTNWILSQLMNVEERDAEILNRLEKIYRLLDDENYEVAEEYIDKLEQMIGTDDKDIIRLRTILDFSRD